MRPRYGRIATLGAAALVTAVTVLGGLGVLPAGGGPSYASTGQDDTADAATLTSADPVEVAEEGAVLAPTTVVEEPDPDDLEVPADSGEGKRVVFDEEAQRVWLVNADGSVERTYLVSGSTYDNLDPGSYSVYSRSRRAWGVGDSGTMQFMVRFAYGAEAPIGFHDIPVLDGEKVQPRTLLGTPQSEGSIRQKTPDAEALWDFAPLATAVVVV